VSEARAREDPARIRRALGSSAVICTMVTLVLVVPSLVFAPALARVLFGATGRQGYLVPVILAVPMSVAASAYVEGFLFGYGLATLYAQMSAIAALAGTVLLISLGSWWGIAGAMWSLCIGAAVLLALFLLAARTTGAPGLLLSWRYDRFESRVLIRTGIAILFTSGLAAAVLVAVRAAVLDRFGPAGNGVVQVPLVFSSYYLLVFTNVLWGRLHPLTSSAGDTPAARNELRLFLVFLPLSAAAVAMVLLASSDLVIRLAYSSSFLGASRLLGWQFLGDVLFLPAFTFGVYLLALGRTKLFVSGYVVFYAIAGSVQLAMVHAGSIRGVVVGYAVAAIAITPLWLGVFARNHGLEPVRHVASALFVAIGGVGTEAVLVSLHVSAVLRVSGLIVWAGVVVATNPRLVPGVLHSIRRS
jgi:O-antigen/teichoic acid export membrane protein